MKKAGKTLEMIILFAGIPLAYYFDVFPFHKFIPLLAGFIYTLSILLLDKSFNRKELGMNGFRKFKPVLFRSILVLFILLIATYLIVPDQLFYLPLNITWLWVVIVLFYPVWSVIPQELIYRTFFFHRYSDILPGKWSMIIANTLAFSFMHIIFENLVAITFSLAAGFALSFLYSKHRSLFGISIEHALYGILVFTIGLGSFFYIS